MMTHLINGFYIGQQRRKYLPADTDLFFNYESRLIKIDVEIGTACEVVARLKGDFRGIATGNIGEYKGSTGFQDLIDFIEKGTL